MSSKGLIVLVFFIFNLGVSASETSSFNSKSAFYKAFSSGDTLQLNQQLKHLTSTNIAEKNAYIGALNMKKAGIIVSLNKKLKLFSEGKKKLESAISADLDNAEYRFLRLAVQENCPAILKYNGNISEDVKKISTSFKQMDSDLKSAILDYCKNSKNLKEKEL